MHWSERVQAAGNSALPNPVVAYNLLQALEEADFGQLVTNALPTQEEKLQSSLLRDKVIAAFEAVDEDETDMVPRLDLRKKLDHVAKSEPRVKSLAELMKSLDQMVVERDEYEDLVDNWLTQPTSIITTVTTTDTKQLDRDGLIDLFNTLGDGEDFIMKKKLANKLKTIPNTEGLVTEINALKDSVVDKHTFKKILNKHI